MVEKIECKRCIYNTERVPNLSFNKNGQCNYCDLHDQIERDYPTGEEGWKKLQKIAEEIKKNGKNKKYDCVIGVSGGCDSTYMLHIAKKELGLRPLAVHFDNTWNSKIAVENIQNVLKKLDIDLYTEVIDNEEMNDMIYSFLKASVPEIDSITDLALATVLYRASKKYGIKYILDGHNYRTEGTVPLGLIYFDGKYISSIHKKFGKIKMKTYPNLPLTKFMYYLFKGIKRVRPLYYRKYDKEEIKIFLEKEYDWKWYGGHHQENRYTTFQQRFWRPVKFNMDMRYVEFSALVRSGLMTRENAIKTVEKPAEFDKSVIEEIKKRLKISDQEFDELLKAENKTSKDYPTYHKIFKKMRPIFWIMYKKGLIPRTFYEKYTK